jgi:hypothetical protein
MNHTADDGIANAMDAIDYGTIVILATANAVVLSAGAYYLHKFPSFAGTRTPVEDGTALYKIGRFAQLLAFCTGVLSLVTLGWGKFAKQSTHLDTDTDIGLFFIKYYVKTTTKDAEPTSTAGVVIICDKEVDDDDDDLAVVRDEVPFYNANGAGCSNLSAARTLLAVAVALAMVVPCLRGCCSSPFVRKLAECLLHLDVLMLEVLCYVQWEKSKNNFTHMTSSYSAYMLLASIALQSVVLICACGTWKNQSSAPHSSKDTRYNPLLPGGRNENGCEGDEESKYEPALQQQQQQQQQQRVPHQQQPPPPLDTAAAAHF